MCLFSRTTHVYSPLCGKISLLDQLEDNVFRDRMLGDGVAIDPTDGQVFAPLNGKVEYIAETLHSIIIKAQHGPTLMIHLGIDTVYLGGEPFECFIQKGQNVKQGALIAKMDLDKIKKQDKKTITPIIVMENKMAQITLTDKKVVTNKDELFSVKL